MNDDRSGSRRSGWQIGLGVGVVLLGLAAVVGALLITLDHFPVQPQVDGQPGSDRSSAVVAVLTPAVAAITGIVGLYFGVSASGSTRGQQAQAAAQVAQSATEAAKSTTDAAQSAAVRIIQSAADAPDRGSAPRAPGAGSNG